MHDVIVTSVGADRPGIVASLTRVVRELGGNLEDCRASHLCGAFAVALLLNVPDEVSAADVKSALAPVAAELEMSLSVGPVEHEDDHDAHDRCMISVYGPDQPGIVSAMTTAISAQGANIVELSSRALGNPAIYVLGIEVELPDGLTAKALQSRLTPVALQYEVELAVISDDVGPDDSMVLFAPEPRPLLTPEVVLYPDFRLKSPTLPIGEIDPEVVQMAAALERIAGVYPRTVGLAAPQLGIMHRMIFVDCAGHKLVPSPRSPKILINPVVTAADGSEIGREGCLSLPDITANVRRAREIEVAARDLEGREVHLELEGFEARVVLHEIDHLDGILILDRVASPATDLFARKVRSSG